MAEVRRRAAVAGFSLVELLVALVFTMVLMAGMANVYKASLSTFFASGEAVSSTRRGRMSVDLLVDDLNQACQFLTDLATPPLVSDLMAPFMVLPNMAVASPGEHDPAATDELYFYLDQVLPFEATLDAGTQKSAAELVLAGTVPVAADTSFTLACGSAAYAGQVQAGQALIFKDALETATITGATVSGSTVTVTTGALEQAAYTGASTGAGAARVKHRAGSRVLVVQPAQMVRYRIEMVALDPGGGAGVPCLVRDQGAYSTTGFTATAAQRQVIAEQVAAFAVYLSADGGTTWAGVQADGTKASYSGYDAGWEAGLRSELDAQLATAGRPEFRTTRGSPTWFRSIPILVRVDVTTRSATRRTEYATTAGTLAHRLQTQSLVVVPRHAGLALN